MREDPVEANTDAYTGSHDWEQDLTPAQLEVLAAYRATLQERYPTLTGTFMANLARNRDETFYDRQDASPTDVANLELEAELDAYPFQIAQ